LAKKNVWRILSSSFLWLGWIYLTVSCALFILFAPLETEVFGFGFSFSTFDKPLQISLVFILLGLIIKFVSTRTSGLKRKGMAAILFCLVLLIYIRSPVMTSSDSRWSVPTAKSLTKEGNTNLDEYRAFISQDDYRIEQREGHLYTIFPIGSSLLAAPIAMITNENVIDESYMDVERLVASLLIAVSSLFIYFISLSALENQKYALLMAIIFAFCTPTWSTASRALWQHGPSITLLTLALFIVFKAKNRSALIQYLSLPLAFSYVVRPTNLIPFALFSLLVLFRYRKYFIRYLLWSLTIIVPFLIYNLSIYHSLLSPYYLPGRLDSHSHLFEALAANLISPSRGLLIYSPVFFLALYGIFLKLKRHRFEHLDFILCGIIVLHWLAISSFPHWWAGHSYGPRFFSDMTPFFLYFLLPVVMDIRERKRKNWVFLTTLVLVLTALSFFINYRGAVSTEVFEWNIYPVDVDLEPERIWDWKDIQFLRGIQ